MATAIGKYYDKCKQLWKLVDETYPENIMEIDIQVWAAVHLQRLKMTFEFISPPNLFQQKYGKKHLNIGFHYKKK